MKGLTDQPLLTVPYSLFLGVGWLNKSVFNRACDGGVGSVGADERE